MDEIITSKNTIRLGKYEDIPNIIRFIQQEWNPNHIYVKSREFFEYEHYIDGRVNGILAINNATLEIDAILLFYQTQRKLEGSDFYGGIWCVSKKCEVPMLGYKLVSSVKQLTNTRGHSGVGINPNTTVKIFSYIKEQFVGKMKHYYRIADLDSYSVAVINKKYIQNFLEYNCELIKFFSIQQLRKKYDLVKNNTIYPYKDEWYIERRYFRHPIYNYLIYGIKYDDIVQGILFTREIEQNGVKVLRIVDFIGDRCAIAKVGKPLQNLMEKEHYEYIDFYEYGINNEIMVAAGFIERNDKDDNIIPNYFEPFVCKNIDLWFHTPYQEFMFFKADGDQDRPNFIIE